MRPAAPRIHSTFAFLSALITASGCTAPPPNGSDALPPDAILNDLRSPPRETSVALVRVHSGPGPRRFDPADLSLPAGSTIRFVLTGTLPDAVVFDTTLLAAAARAHLRERGAVRGPLLTQPGQVYDVDFREAPPGDYRFASLLQGASGVHGIVRIGARASESGRRGGETP
jgi:plastocyanin